MSVSHSPPTCLEVTWPSSESIGFVDLGTNAGTSDYQLGDPEKVT